MPPTVKRVTVADVGRVRSLHNRLLDAVERRDDRKRDHLRDELLFQLGDLLPDLLNQAEDAVRWREKYGEVDAYIVGLKTRAEASR